MIRILTPLLAVALLAPVCAARATAEPPATQPDAATSAADPAPLPQDATPGMLAGGRYGDVRLVVPAGRASAYVVYLSDRGGWRAADQAVLEAIAAAGAIAVGVDLDRYYRKVGADRGAVRSRCDGLIGDVEGLSRQLQHRLQGDTYYFPIMAGMGEGGALAMRVLAQAPDHTLSGAVALNPARTIRIPVRLCKGPPGAPFGFRNTAVLAPSALADAPARIVALLQPHINVPSADGVAALPLEELPSSVPGPLLAVVLTGDGGWRDLDRTIAENLQRSGVAVVGWDCLRYFWHERTAQETADDLATALRYYSARWHGEQIALIGYSFGADVLPAVYARLPADLRGRVVLVSLLALSPKADWEISVTGWLGAPPTDKARAIAEDLAALPPAIVQCIYGAEELDSPCPGLVGSGADVVRTTGGHHFDRRYDVLAQRILAKFRQGATVPDPAGTPPAVPASKQGQQ